MKPIKGLDLTPEEAAAIQKYREWIGRRNAEGKLNRYYPEVDRLFPGIDAEMRHELAESMYRAHMAEQTRAQRAKE